MLDTWFSSALWPFSTLGWPNKTKDLEYFYPTSVLVTGYDIITFWVSKMIFSGLDAMNEIPFRYVCVHGLVRDSQGRKMSKSLGNGIDPLEVIDKYGADALRFTLATGNSPGNDMRFNPERVEAARNFANKIWNAARFILMNLDIEEVVSPLSASLEIGLAQEDKWLLHKFNALIADVTENIDKYELGIALSKLYDFFWDVFCDWYIELVKPRLSDKDCPSNKAAQNTITYVFTEALKLLHPFMPFITEEIYLTLPHGSESIMISQWPKVDPDYDFAVDADNTQKAIELIRLIRNRRAEMNVPPSKKAHIFIKTDEKAAFSGSEQYFSRLAGASGVTFVDEFDAENSVAVVSDSAVCYIPLSEMIDFDKERERIAKENERLNSEIERINKKLSNAEFVSKAPERVINAERDKLAGYINALENLREAAKKIEI
ncbi:Valine--tRNA ligase [bioreactor metagenome]|uniref:valine--tRNA ligase n=1 Tax=bioreactor metagenome TaxID=1076179 RepID=A0A645CTK2_9ZZZZ